MQTCHSSSKPDETKAIQKCKASNQLCPLSHICDTNTHTHTRIINGYKLLGIYICEFCSFFYISASLSSWACREYANNWENCYHTRWGKNTSSKQSEVYALLCVCLSVCVCVWKIFFVFVSEWEWAESSAKLLSPTPPSAVPKDRAFKWEFGLSSILKGQL